MAQNQLVEHFGGIWRRHASLVLALWALAHGTVELLISKVVPPARAAELRKGMQARCSISPERGRAKIKR